jgi:inorganic phosphate transporter, PiT family
MTFVLLVVGVALVFDFINGMHDSANSIATVVSTRVLTPLMAVFWAAFFNFVAAFVFGTAVARTIGSGLIDVKVVNSNVVLGGLIGAIAWNLSPGTSGFRPPLPTRSSEVTREPRSPGSE